MVIYIAGPITGHTDYKEKFDAAEKRLKSKGHGVLNPAILPQGLPNAAYMPICIAMLEQADMIYLLDGWENSPGACLEKAYAEYQNKIIREENHEI